MTDMANDLQIWLPLIVAVATLLLSFIAGFGVAWRAILKFLQTSERFFGVWHRAVEDGKITEDEVKALIEVSQAEAVSIMELIKALFGR